MSDVNIKSTIKIRKCVLARDHFNIGYYTHVPINVHVRYIRQCYIAICDIAQNILKHSKRNSCCLTWFMNELIDNLNGYEFI